MENISDIIFDNSDTNFDIPSHVLDEIQQNIQNIIESFDIPDANKSDVIKKINFMYSHTKQMSLTDSLTGLYNRRHLQDTLNREFSRAKRYQNELSFAIIDIDFFKKVNDTYGHACGDFILKKAAYMIMNNFRFSDIVFRFGGEEFAVILAETSLDDAKIPLERLRELFEKSNFNYKGQTVKITISIGVSSVREETESVEQLFDNADKALYEAKAGGRNMLKTY